MLQKEVYFEDILTYKIKMFKCMEDLILNGPLSYFQGLRSQILPRAQKTSQSYLQLCGQNPPRSQLAGIPLSLNPAVLAEDTFFKILVWMRKGKGNREQGRVEARDLVPDCVLFSPKVKLSSMSGNCWATYLAGTRWDSFSSSIDIYWAPTLGLPLF